MKHRWRDILLVLYRQITESKSIFCLLLILCVSVSGLVLINSIAKTNSCDIILETIKQTDEHILIAFVSFFAFSFFLFLTVIPLGTVSVVTAGFILGPAAGAVQYIALACASILLYEIGRDEDERSLVRLIDRFPRLRYLINLFQSNGIAFCVASRILPIVPSAIASLAASYIGINRRDYVIGTISAGWVRPVGFGLVGALGQQLPLCS